MNKATTPYKGHTLSGDEILFPRYDHQGRDWVTGVTQNGDLVSMVVHRNQLAALLLAFDDDNIRDMSVIRDLRRALYCHLSEGTSCTKAEE